ncbi:MAG: MogA/MoaB family molybdenum cofactor biosynthesis protein [Chloroflexi bacterium]|nr:MogA/MoaB family molybdenum cofactor biosynthesis protein [Chloroflexota bacterium]
MSYLEHKKAAPQSVNCAVLIISDSRTEADDESGKLLKQKLGEHGHRVMAYAILKNDADAVSKKIKELLGQDGLQVIITSGGTGAGRRDVTVETISPILEKKLDGFGELFRFLTYQELGTGSIMSRAIGGVAAGKVILCLPGSLGAVTLAIDKIILPEIGHLVREATR